VFWLEESTQSGAHIQLDWSWLMICEENRCWLSDSYKNKARLVLPVDPLMAPSWGGLLGTEEDVVALVTWENQVQRLKYGVFIEK
jgi:hypothetical protein